MLKNNNFEPAPKFDFAPPDFIFKLYKFGMFSKLLKIDNRWDKWSIFRKKEIAKGFEGR
jgi:hypothetical protein